MKQVNGHEIISLFEQWSPKRYALEGDPNGLHIGKLNLPVQRVLITLDVNEAVVDEAIQVGAQLIIAHHPPLFRPVKSIQTDTPQGRMIEKCIKQNISVYAAHTNLDVAPGGVNDLLAEKLKLNNPQALVKTYEEKLTKLIVFCPHDHANTLRHALAHAGAGAIGHYVGCSYTTEGIGRFTPQSKANPFIGEAGKEERVEEERIEVIVEQSVRTQVLKALFANHPYEEPAYDLIPLDQTTNELGLGRIGMLEKEMTLLEFAHHVKTTLDVPAARFVGKPETKVRKVAVLGGDGNKYVYAAKRQGADVFVTGDLYYHVAQDAEALDLAVVDPGHHVEKVMIQGVANQMQRFCNERKFDVQFIESTVHTEPFTFI